MPKSRQLSLPAFRFFVTIDGQQALSYIYSEAYEAKDFRTMQFLDWFVKEQGEEETNAKNLISKIELFGSDPKSLYMLNQELAARVYSAPSLVL